MYVWHVCAACYVGMASDCRRRQVEKAESETAPREVGRTTPLRAVATVG